ncbi:DNA primase [Candidatus Odyssella thessalonicensis]|uniref:DNA primase n=1 Tax=Candidatus Odyssella thessalonicensis TaxID=84647 RepID=UPI000225A970|nr:DNA primase [Candidatus Odyssella thessalonicensis]
MTKLKDHLDAIRDRLPLSVVIAPYVALKKRGRSLTGLCPFHNEKGASFSVADDKGFYHCFGCGAHGDHFSFIVEKLHMPFMEAVEHLTRQAGLTMPKFEKAGDNNLSTPDGDHNKILYEINEVACQYFEAQLRAPENQPVRDYLKQRGMTGIIAKQFRIGYAPARGLAAVLQQRGYRAADCITSGLLIAPDNQRPAYERFRDRVMFPIQDSRGRVIAFGGRIIGQGEPKYLNSPETPLFHKGRQLYAHNHSIAAVRGGQTFVVVEGYMDVISLHQAGLAVAVAPLGTALTTEQVALMWRSCPKPVLCFDGDSAGRRAAQRAAQVVLENLKPGYTVEFCFLPLGEDPDSFIKKNSVTAFREILKFPVPLAEVLWQIFMEGRVLTSPEDKAKARQDLIQLSHRIPDPEVRHFYQQDLNQRLQQLLTQKPRETGQSQKILIHQGVKPGLMKKIIDGQKILLATLINHPTLVADVAEQLMLIKIEDEILDSLRNFLLDFCSEDNHTYSNNLLSVVREKGFGSFVDQALTQDLYLKARFAHPSSDLDQARSGWLEVWHFLERNSQLKDTADQASLELKSDFNQRTWQSLQSVKRQQSQL